jgi:hypothetical protein
VLPSRPSINSFKPERERESLTLIYSELGARLIKLQAILGYYSLWRFPVRTLPGDDCIHPNDFHAPGKLEPSCPA